MTRQVDWLLRTKAGNRQSPTPADLKYINPASSQRIQKCPKATGSYPITDPEFRLPRVCSGARGTGLGSPARSCLQTSEAGLPLELLEWRLHKQSQGLAFVIQY